MYGFLSLGGTANETSIFFGVCTSMECFNATVVDDSILEKEEVFSISVTLSEEDYTNGILLVNSYLEFAIEDNDHG